MILAVAALWGALVLGFLSPPQARSQGFGENHVVRRDFDWRVRSTEHFDVHTYEESAPWARAAAENLERSYARIRDGLGTGFAQRRPVFIYGSVNDMQQSNIVEVGDGTGGVTEAFKDRFMVYNDGSRQWLDDVLTHELVHVFQFHVLNAGFWKSARILKAFVYPLWMMEGMAEYFTSGLDDTTGQIYLRDAATSGGLIPLWKMEHFSHLKPHQVTLAYKSGATVMEFIASQYGEDRVGKLLKLFESHFESNSVLQDLLGLDIFAFDRKWREYLEEKYRRVARRERLEGPEAYGVSLTTSTGKIPEFNTSPVFTPDGARVAYISTRFGQPPAVMMTDLRSGRRKRLVDEKYLLMENIPLGYFVNLSRVLAISPDGRTLAFSAQKNHVESLYFYDLAKRKLRRRKLPGFMTISEPAFSPDGKRLAFAGMKGGVTDLYLLDLGSGEVSQLTHDSQDDQSPAFSPDGGSIVYSSEIEIPGDSMPYQRRLYRLELDGLAAQRLVELRGAARDPVYSPDGRRVLFSLEADGFYEVYELELETRRVQRLTRSIGASYTPVYAPDGEIAFSAFRRGSVHVYKAPRGRLLAEAVSPLKVAREAEPVSKAPALGDSSRQGQGERRTAAPALPGTSTHSVTAALSDSKPFRNSASLDLFLPAFFYSSQGGLFWTSYAQASDMLGNHQTQGLVSYNSGEGFLNYQTAYSYARFRPRLSLGLSGFILPKRTEAGTGLLNDRSVHAQVAQVQYPLDRYHRLELVAGAVTEVLQYPDIRSQIRHDARIVSSAFVRDSVGGRYLVANRGSRLRLAYTGALEALGGHDRYDTVYGEGHKYFRLADTSALVVRGLSASSWGPQSQQFTLGGIGGVRGYARSVSENVGYRGALATAELRFPVVPNLDYYMWYFFPDFYFKMISLAFFTDAGYAWNTGPQLSGAHWRDIRHSYGVGLRLHTFILQLFPLVLHFDYAQRATSDGGVFYVYLGPLF
ncbi:MAG: PD40 domain-containing protein [Elusimicrobia bacterium]|nr:PD40 domain-containing protein [Elusimicrobiota bacterium]